MTDFFGQMGWWGAMGGPKQVGITSYGEWCRW